MKLTKIFASFIYYCMAGYTIICTLYLVFGISAKIFGTDGQYIMNIDGETTLKIGSKNSEGYLVPVQLTLQIPDSVSKNQEYFGVTAEDVYPHITTDFLRENKKIKAINTYDVSYMSMEPKTFISDSNGNYINRKPSKFKFIKYCNIGDSQYLKIRTNDALTNFFLGLRVELKYLIFILQMYFITLILREIARKIYFSQRLSAYISKLGYVLLFSQLIPFIYAFIDLNLFGAIKVAPQILQSLQNSYFENITVLFNPTIDVKVYVIFLGGILILFTKLIKRGRLLEEDNELTI
ncbi:hypothetical protein [Flavobacterium olei]|uniref:hypothetical protein n=1 Tax=Flavobacterium olei TaxID=1886782 RepID=UPI00321A72C6